MAAVAVAVCTAIGSIVAVFAEEEAGLFCAAIGLIALSVRCGPVRPVFQFAGGASVLLGMALEVVLLGGFVFASWWGALRLFTKVRNRQSPAASAAAPNEMVDATLNQKLMATGIQIVVMGLLEQILIQTDVKAQALAGVGIAAFVGTLVAYMVFSLPSGIWYWVGPTLVGLIGYLLAYCNAEGLNVGEIHGWAAAMARPVPLDYAGMGTLGALVGYWCSRTWAHPEEFADDAPATVE